MFCSWKKSADAPCSCAFVLQAPVMEVLNGLCHLGQGTLVLRQQGLSLAKSTPFGLCVAYRQSGWNVLLDRVSGLETDVGHPQNLYLLVDECGRPLLAMGLPGQPIELSIRLEGHRWDSPSIREMKVRYRGKPLDCFESRRLGAGAWLDEWGELCKRPPQERSFLAEASALLHECHELEVDVRTTSHRNRARFAPSFIDSEGPVLRLADKSREHVVYADMDAADIHLTRLSPSSLRLSCSRTGPETDPGQSATAA